MLVTPRFQTRDMRKTKIVEVDWKIRKKEKEKEKLTLLYVAEYILE